MINKKTLYILLGLASIPQYMCSMSFWSKALEPSPELESANKAFQDDKILRSIKKDPKLNLLLWMLENNKTKLEKRIGLLENPEEGQYSLPDINRRLVDLENAGYEDQIKKLNEIDEELKSTLENRYAQLEKALEKIEKFEEQIAEFTIKNGEQAKIVSNLPSKIKELNQAIDNNKSKLDQSDTKIRELEAKLQEQNDTIQNQDRKIQEQNDKLKKLEPLYSLIENIDFPAFIAKLMEKHPLQNKSKEVLD